MGNLEQPDNQSDAADNPSDVACERQIGLSIHYNRERNQNLREKKFKEFKKSRVKTVFYTPNTAIQW